VGARLAVISDGAAAPAPSAPAQTVAEPAPPAQAAVVEVAPSPPEAPPSVPSAGTPPPPPPGYATNAPPLNGQVEPAAAVPAPPPASGPSAEPRTSAPEPGPEQRSEQLILSPVVRRLLNDNNVDPSSIRGTGLGGRITREDVLAHLDATHVPPPSAPVETVAGAAPEPPAPAPAQAIPAQASPVQASPVQASPPASVTPAAPPSSPARTANALVSAGEQIVPFSNMRRRTAEHMVRSKAVSPHAFIAHETDFENVERVRKGWGQRFKAEEGFSLTYLPFIARASVEALRDFPSLNASVGEDALVLHAQINLGVAVDLDHEGLIVPVIHRAEEITLRGIARRIRDLADRARTRQLTADDITGGTFSITNDGPFGTFFTVPIINQPQVAILATDGIKRRPVVITLPDGTESIAIHSTGVLGMSWDHRAVDGAYVSSFLARVAELIATRDWASEL
jgi:pyruvate dehydrogenase E2 component (dihydrolipoamide acetyltransferase)